MEEPSEPTAEAYKAAFFDSVTQKSFNDVFSVNATGAYWMTFAFLPLLEKWKNSAASERFPAGKKFVPQVVMTSSMNGWTKVGSCCIRPSIWSFADGLTVRTSIREVAHILIA